MKNIENIIIDGENESYEFKLNWPESMDLIRNMIAFANHNGGSIIVGLDDSKNIKGVEINPKVESKIEEIARNSCTPPIRYNIKYLDYNDYKFCEINIPKSLQIHFTNKGETYTRSGSHTVKLFSTINTQGTRIYTESGQSNYLIDLDIPPKMHPGEELILNCIKLAEHKNIIKVKFHWGDESIQVIGANMISPNNFEFPPSERITSWYLKFCASQSINCESDKSVYVSVEEITSNKRYLKLGYWAAAILIFLSFFPLILNLIDFFTGTKSQISLVYGPLSIPLPFATIFTLIVLNKQITSIIQRLSNIKLSINTKYIEKGVTDNNSIAIKILKIRFDNNMKNKNAL